MNRRFFMKNGGIALASLGAMTASPSFLTRALAQVNKTGRKRVLIAIFQRGAMDGLNAVIPYGEPEYYNLRPGLAIPRPGSSVQNNQSPAIDLDGFFGLHPSLLPFKSIYTEG